MNLCVAVKLWFMVVVTGVWCIDFGKSDMVYDFGAWLLYSVCAHGL